MSTPDAPTPGPGRTDNVVPAPGEALDPADFDRLVSDILEHPEHVLKSDLTSEQILEIQKRINPYAGIGGPPAKPDQVHVAACSYTNLREDYLRRFTMTSLEGFLYQVLEEWEVPAAQRRWVPAAKKKADGPEYQPFDADRLVESLEATLLVAREAKTAKAAAVELQQKAREADLCLPTTPSEQDLAGAAALRVEADAASEKAIGLLYAATYGVHQGGLDATKRLRSTAEAGLKYPQVKAILSQSPLPSPPGQIEMPPAAAKAIITGFLNNWLTFDPSVHVRSGCDEKKLAAAVEKLQVGKKAVAVDAKDPGHLLLETVLADAPEPAAEHADAFRTITSSKTAYNAVAALLRDEDLVDAALTAIQDPEVFKLYLFPVAKTSPARPAAEHIPPQDTFHRWGYYTEVNYEELRTITEAVYPERPDLDWAIALWADFAGTQKEVDEAFKKHCERYQEEVPSSIKALEFGHWSLLADFKENRKKIQFYNKNTTVLERILERHADDKRIGAELMRNRVRQTKAKNIAEEGPDAPGLAKYRQGLAEQKLDLTSKGVQRVISPEEMKRLEKARGNIKAAHELELLEQYEKTIADLTELEKLRVAAGKTLTEEERRDLDFAKANIDKVREMVAVPDDAIQVDVFTSDPSTGGFEKSHFYTKAVAPEHIAAARKEFEQTQGKSGHPAVTGNTPVPPFAPYAVDHILSADQRTPEQMKAEALRDAEAHGAQPGDATKK